MGTAVALTQTATVWTPTPTNTPDPDEPKIVEWLNESLMKADGLQQTFDVKFRAVDAIFLPGVDNKPLVFRINVHCECANSLSSCCTPERAFVVTMWAMKDHNEKVYKQVPPSVLDVQVACFDHNIQIGMAMVTWRNVTSYLFDSCRFFYTVSKRYRFQQNAIRGIFQNNVLEKRLS
jgi:hypothetical protein